MARKRWTDNIVSKLAVKPKRYAAPDPEMAGLWVRVQPSGAKTYVVVTYRDKKQKWISLGNTRHLSLDEAREKAREKIRAVKDGKPSADPQSFEIVAAQWIKRHVDNKGLRSKDQIERHLARMTKAWEGRSFETIRRGDVATFLDNVEDNSGPRAADIALSVFRGMANWFATRHEDYSSPVVKGMARQKPSEHARARILDDDEIRALWKLAETKGDSFGALMRLLLLTGQRLQKVQSMRWSDLSDDHAVWTIAAERREKGNAGALVLPKLAVGIIEAQPRFVSNPFVIAGRGDRPIGVSNPKKRYDEELGFKEQWQLHDLRRTARSLMSRAGVTSEHAERVLGHAIGGVEGIYDRHSYEQEKAHALRALAGLIETITNPPAANVVAFG